MSGERGPYRFGPRDTRGLVLGLRPGQAALVAVSLIVAVGALRAAGGPTRLIVIVVDLTVGLSAAFVPVRGRTLGEWVPVATAFLFAGVAGRRRELPARPNAVSRRPSPFSAFSLIEIEAGEGRRFGAVVDRRSGTVTGVLKVSGSAFALLDDPERERDVAGWSSVLSAIATSPLAPVRVQWIERTIPDRRQALRDRVAELFVEESVTDEEDDAVERAKASYAALVTT
ncbi:MAG TPA: SCO6880 family protein, partial [Acidimicrobiales bacterium]|nr:SCO6880 family protein [Acidimicrobiales bacterium]